MNTKDQEFLQSVENGFTPEEQKKVEQMLDLLPRATHLNPDDDFAPWMGKRHINYEVPRSPYETVVSAAKWAKEHPLEVLLVAGAFLMAVVFHLC